MGRAKILKRVAHGRNFNQRAASSLLCYGERSSPRTPDGISLRTGCRIAGINVKVDGRLKLHGAIKLDDGLQRGLAGREVRAGAAVIWGRLGAGRCEQRAEAKHTRAPPAPHALRVNWRALPGALDPYPDAGSSPYAAVDQLFSGLVELTPEMDVVPSVTRTWEASEGGRRYVFHR
jgi:hypothetical protein